MVDRESKETYSHSIGPGTEKFAGGGGGGLGGLKEFEDVGGGRRINFLRWGEKGPEN